MGASSLESFSQIRKGVREMSKQYVREVQVDGYVVKPAKPNYEQLQQKADQLESEFKDYQYCMEKMLSHMIDLYNAETTSHYSRLYLVGKLNLSEKLRDIDNA